MSIEATRPTHLAALAPGMVIRTEEGDLTVDEIRRVADGWTVFGRPVNRDRRRRVAVTYEGGTDAAIVADKADVDRLRALVIRYATAGARTEATDAPPGAGPTITLTPDKTALLVDGWEVTL